MVMILTKTRENKGADSVTCRTELHTPKMSQGPTLFSCGVMATGNPVPSSDGSQLARGCSEDTTSLLDSETKLPRPQDLDLFDVVKVTREKENDRWGDLGRKCPLQIEQPGASIWDCLADKGEEGSLWPREATSTCSVTNLIKDLSLSDPHGNPSAPPSKRQCRSLSFSDEMSSCRTSWRPLGSKVWTPVEKRRCYSGGSVQRYSNGSATMQRSSSFSLPSRSHPLASSCDHPALAGRLGCQARKTGPAGPGGDTWSPEGGRADMQRSLSCSHDRFSSSEPGPPSASSTPASTPQLGRRAGGLCRSRSQPCVLNDKKVGVKRRRPQEAQEQRPSLDLAKMTQNRQTFNSLSCLNTAAEDGAQRLPGARPWPAAGGSPEVMPGRTPACTPVPEPRSRGEERRASRDDFSCEESDCGAAEDEGGGKEEDPAPWRGGGTGAESPFQLDGELDIEQIENN